MKLENTEKTLKGVREELNESSKTIVRLETEAADRCGDRKQQ